MNNLNKLGVLFSCVTHSKNSLSKVFTKLAKKWGMSSGSVRNMYYQNYEYVLSNADFCTQYHIDVSKLSKTKGSLFSYQEEQHLLDAVANGKKNGKSVRAVCCELAGGNVALMVRYCNKYRSLIKKHQIANSLNSKGEKPSNVIQMPLRQDVLTDADIQALFMGLVRLVKNNTIKEMNCTLNQKYSEKVQEASNLKHSLSVVQNELNEQIRINKKMQNELYLLKQSRLASYQELMQNINKKDAVKDC